MTTLEWQSSVGQNPSQPKSRDRICKIHARQKVTPFNTWVLTKKFFKKIVSPRKLAKIWEENLYHKTYI